MEADGPRRSISQRSDEMVDASSVPGNAILMYHSVGERYPDGRILSIDDFREHLAYLDSACSIVDLPEVMEAGSSPRIALTFDAGYENFHRHALPVLQEYGAPATQFIIPDRIGRRNGQNGASSIWNEWFDFMNADQIRSLVDGDLVTIGNKSLTHVSILPAYRDECRLREEVTGGKAALEERFDIDVHRFCFGSGRFEPRSVGVVRESHELAVTTQHRFVASNEDPILLPRFDADFIDRQALERKLTASFARRRKFRRWIKRRLGAWHPETDDLVMRSVAEPPVRSPNGQGT